MTITPFFDGITLELTSQSNINAHWEFMNPDQTSSGTDVSKQYIHNDAMRVHRVNASDSDSTFVADIRSLNPLQYSGDGDHTWTGSPSFTIINYLPITLKLNITGIDNYDWNGNRPDHNYPEGIENYTLPSAYSNNLDINLAFPTVLLYPNPHSSSIPFDLTVSGSSPIFTDRIYYGHFDVNYENDSYTTTLWSPSEDVSGRTFTGHWETPKQLGDFTYYDNNGNQQTGHRVITRRQYMFNTGDTDTPIAFVTTTILQIRPGYTPGPI